MKVRMTHENWVYLENVLQDLEIGYKVNFDNHNGSTERLVTIDTISVYYPSLEEEEA